MAGRVAWMVMVPRSCHFTHTQCSSSEAPQWVFPPQYEALSAGTDSFLLQVASGQPRATPRSGGNLRKTAARKSESQFTPSFSFDMYHLPLDTVSKNKTVILTWKITSPPLILGVALWGGQKKCKMKGEMRSSSGTEHHCGYLGLYQGGRKSALCITRWGKRTSNLNSVMGESPLTSLSICQCKRGLFDSEGFCK